MVNMAHVTSAVLLSGNTIRLHMENAIPAQKTVTITSAVFAIGLQFAVKELGLHDVSQSEP
jgi:uncharacterized membrane protein YadS